MPRYRRYTKTIIKAPKKPWNPGYTFANYDIQTMSGVNNGAASTIVQNTADNTAPTPAVIQAKHVKVMGTIVLQGAVDQAGPATPVYVTSYIIYVPQIVYSQMQSHSSHPENLYNWLLEIVRSHPEWVMTTKNVNVKFQGGLPGEHDVTKFTQSSGKMKRNLKSGDRLMHFILFKNLTQAAIYQRSLYFEYQWVNRSN